MLYFNNLIPIGTLMGLIPSISGSPLNTRDGLIGREAIVSLLEKRAAPYQTRILDIGTTFGEETDGTWQLIDADGDGVPDLAFIKTSNTGTSTVEVHIASASSNFQTRIWESGSTFAEETDGTWLLVPSKAGLKPDLAFIKTSNTGTNSVEVHIASGASGYQTRTLETGTTFAEETDGSWSLYDFDGDGILDLIFIKTSNAGTSSVEVHVASGASNYQTRIFESGTTFAEETDGVWSLVPFSSRADLGFIKTSNTAGTVEVHIASRASNYATRIQELGSDFGEETDGVWSLIDFNRDGVLDLAFIKTQNTGTGTVEVHVSSGN